MPGNPNKLVRFWQELKRRRVFNVIVVYATAAFIIIELVSNVFEPLLLPEWTPTLVIVILAIMFPIALIFSWIFDVTFQGIKKTEPLASEVQPEEVRSTSAIFAPFDKSIAVLPFQDMSPNKDQEYFCDGITEEIINALTHIESLKVIARTSAFAFKNKHADIREIGQKLNVETLLEGSIRKDGKRLRITAQLIKVADGFHLWSDVYNRELEDVFAIQEEISLAIVQNLKLKLFGGEKAEIVSRAIEDMESYNLLLLAHHFQSKGSEEAMKNAIDYYEQVIEKVQNSAQAYAGLAFCYTLLGFLNSIAPISAFPKAKEAALKSIEIDQTLTEAHASLGLVMTYYDWDWEGAENAFTKALDLSPNYAQAYQGLAFLNMALGKEKECLVASERAVELDPLSAVLREILGFALLRTGRIEQAREEFMKALELEPNYTQARWLLGHTYMLESDYDTGISEIEKALEQSNGNPLICSGMGWAYAISGRKSDAENLVAEMERRIKNEYIGAYLFAKIYAALGETDRAFEWLDKAYEEHDVSLVFIRSDETLMTLHSDGRFNLLLNRIGLDRYKEN